MNMADSPLAEGTDAPGGPGGSCGPGVADVTESWRDQRSRGAQVLGRVFTGKVAHNRAEANREGMRTTLARLKRELEAG